jgi:hypothetical protein
MLDPILNDKIYKSFFFKYHKKMNQVNSGQPIKYYFQVMKLG